MRPTLIELTFDEAVAEAKRVCHLSGDCITELTLHPDGLWTVRYTIGEPTIIHERPLNIEDQPTI